MVSGGAFRPPAQVVERRTRSCVRAVRRQRDDAMGGLPICLVAGQGPWLMGGVLSKRAC